jgi:uncharacterized membrane protein YdfJ with MMPL/SSD domain
VRTFAACCVRGRWLVVLTWAGIIVALSLTLPTIEQGGSGGLGALVPQDASAI